MSNLKDKHLVVLVLKKNLKMMTV